MKTNGLQQIIQLFNSVYQAERREYAETRELTNPFGINQEGEAPEIVRENTSKKATVYHSALILKRSQEPTFDFSENMLGVLSD